MKRGELLALGIPEENARKFQELYNRDLNRMVRRVVREKDPDDLRKAITYTLVAIEDTDRLRAILATVTHQYLKEYREREGMKNAALSAANTRDGEAEQKVSETQCSALSLPKDERECQV